MNKGIAGQVPTGYYTRSMLSKKIDRSVTVIKRMESSGAIAPVGEMECGQIVVKLYHDDQLPTIREIVRKRKPGKPRSAGLHRCR